MGPRQNPRRATVLQSDGVKRSPSWSAPNITEDSHGAFRRDRRVVGTQQCVRGGDGVGKIVREAKVASEPEALVRFFRGLETGVTRIGLEAGPLSQWLHAGLVAAAFEVVLLETRHVKAALSAMVIKTDRKDARGIRQLLRMGWFRPVHAKSPAAQEVRALLVARKLLQTKLLDVESALVAITFKSAVDNPGRFA